MNMEWDFRPDSDLRIEEDTEAIVTAVPGPTGELMQADKVSQGTKDVLRIRFQIAEGEHRGKRASLTLWPDANNFAFRAQFHALTGINVSKGERGGPNDIVNSLAENSFHVKLGIDKNGYTIVKFINERLPRVDVATSTEIPTGMSTSSAPHTSVEDDDDIPF
jgi:hypothetical protein